MLSLIFLPYEASLLLASFLLYQHIVSIRSSYGISIDYAFFSLTWSLSHSLANCLYCFSSQARIAYSERYPLFGTVPSSELSLGFNIAQICLCTATMRLILFRYKSRESLSMLCKTIMLMCLAALLLFAWLYAWGRATIILLDIADILHVIGSICLACRLIPQVSVNWFLDCCTLRRAFLLAHLSAQLIAMVALVISKELGVMWYDMPVSSPSWACVVLNSLALLALFRQKRLYKTKHGRATPIERSVSV